MPAAKYTYLLLNFLTIFFPIVLSFDKRVHFYKSWKYLWPGMAVTGLMFLFWDVLFILKGVWSFNNNYITGLTIFQLPIEEVLFFLTVPFACVFIYQCLNYYIKWEISDRITRLISGLLILTSIAEILFNHHKLYTLITFGLLLILLLLLQYGFKYTWLNNFYRTYLVTLIPFYIINGVLTSLPVVVYNNAENMGKRIGTIPVEDHFYCMALLLMNVGFFEYFRRKKQTIHD